MSICALFFMWRQKQPVLAIYPGSSRSRIAAHCRKSALFCDFSATSPYLLSATIVEMTHSRAFIRALTGLFLLVALLAVGTRTLCGVCQSGATAAPATHVVISEFQDFAAPTGWMMNLSSYITLLPARLMSATGRSMVRTTSAVSSQEQQSPLLLYLKVANTICSQITFPVHIADRFYLI